MGGSVSLIDGHIDEVCPCTNCKYKKSFARAWDLHWHDGEDCPLECPQWDEWKARNNDDRR